MSQKNIPSMDLSAFAGLFSPGSKTLGTMSGSTLTPLMPITSPMNGANSFNMNNITGTPMQGTPGAVPKTLTSNRGVRTPASPMRQNMMGKSPFFPFGAQ